MAFHIEFSAIAAEKFKKLEGPLRERLVRKLDQVAENPRRHLRRLAGIGAYSVRVGDYRVLVDVDFARETIFVLTLGHRRTIYRK